MNIPNFDKKHLLAYNKSRINTGLFSSSSDEWETPQYVFNILKQEFNFQIDVCANSENTKCKEYFTKEIDGLKQEWSPYRCWMNPPYGRTIKQWMKKALDESKKGALVVCLIPSRTDTKWWHEFTMRSAEIRFIEGRLCFGNGKQSAPFPSCIAIFYPEFDNPYKLSVPVIKSVFFNKKIISVNQ
jgi:site-specific DNA-methyltransferase (adenine-specific)